MNDIIHISVAVDHGQESKRAAEAKQNETFLVRRMIRITQQEGLVVAEGGHRLFEGNPVLSEVPPSLVGIPLEARHTRTYILCMYRSGGRVAA